MEDGETHHDNVEVLTILEASLDSNSPRAILKCLAQCLFPEDLGVRAGGHAVLGDDLESDGLLRHGVESEEDLAPYAAAFAEKSRESEVADRENASSLGGDWLRLLDCFWSGSGGLLLLCEDWTFDCGLAPDRAGGRVLLGGVDRRRGGDLRLEFASVVGPLKSTRCAHKDLLGRGDSIAGCCHVEDELGLQFLRRELGLGLGQSASSSQHNNILLTFRASL